MILTKNSFQIMGNFLIIKQFLFIFLLTKLIVAPPPNRSPQNEIPPEINDQETKQEMPNHPNQPQAPVNFNLIIKYMFRITNLLIQNISK